MQNLTWVIDFRRRATAAEVEPCDPVRALELVLRCRRNSRRMFADTRALLAEARAALEARTGGGVNAGSRSRTRMAGPRGRVVGVR